MQADAALGLACVLIAVLVTLPAVQALLRRRASREASDIAAALAELAGKLRSGSGANVLDEGLLARVRRLRMPEAITFEFVQSAQAIPAVARKLRAAFCPGPLTLTLPRRPERGQAAAGGQDTIGLRCPAPYPWPPPWVGR